jgi:hypothetical protein
LTLFLLLDRQERLRDEAEFSFPDLFVHGCLPGTPQRLGRPLCALCVLCFFKTPHLGATLFHNTVAELDTRTDCMKAIGWAPRVPRAERAAFEQAARRKALKDFQILEGDLTLPAGQAKARAADRPEYFPLRFIEPMANNEMVPGLRPGFGTRAPQFPAPYP